MVHCRVHRLSLLSFPRTCALLSESDIEEGDFGRDEIVNPEEQFTYPTEQRAEKILDQDISSPYLPNEAQPNSDEIECITVD